MSFHGLEKARQALSMQQLGLYTIGHNISNINTEGYSRQRVNYETLPSYTSPSLRQPTTPGQIGTGVTADSIERIRDEFLDRQWRTQNASTSYWQANADALFRMESLVNEMDGTQGLNAVLDEFWKSIEDLAVDPYSEAAKRVVAQKAVAVTDTFNHLGKSLDGIKNDLKFQIDDEKGAVSHVNNLLKEIEVLNEKIKEIEIQGKLPNDLYDRRDQALDELSSLLNIQVKYEKSGDNKSIKESAQGIAKIELVTAEGNSFEPQTILLDSENRLEMSIGFLEGSDDIVSFIMFGENNIDIGEFVKSEGEIAALVQNLGYQTEDGVKGNYPDFIKKLDDLAIEFVYRFNKVHEAGFDSDGNEGQPFFEFNGAEESMITITVNGIILEDPTKIATSTNEEFDNGKNASRLADVLSKPFIEIEDIEDDRESNNGKTSINDLYDGLVAELAVKVEEANRQTEFSIIQSQQIYNSRESVIAVSLDEEVTNLIKFQHAYNAAARSLTATDELLDKVINGMGVVGR